MAKDFISLADWSAEELRGILARAAELKRLNREGKRPQTLEGRSLAMFFEKPSLRTHVTFEAGMTQLGGHAIWLRPEQVGIGTRETPGDVAANLSRWVDAIVARTFSHHLVEELAAVAEIPVINGLTDLLHPCQVMADFQTVAERMPLAEAEIAYELLLDMGQVNPTFAQTDVTIVIGANDVVNPAARTDPDSPIAGMPILDVDGSRTVVVIKRSLSPGFAGIPNPLFANDGTLLLFGDGKDAVLDIVAALLAG